MGLSFLIERDTSERSVKVRCGDYALEEYRREVRLKQDSSRGVHRCESLQNQRAGRPEDRAGRLDLPRELAQAKAVGPDEGSLFMTSANLTEGALDRNTEAGLLLRERTTALTALQHCTGLLGRGLLRSVPDL